MDFQPIVDACGMAASVMSVQETENGHCGEIRIVCANEMYKKIMGDKFYDNMIYSELIPKERNFEDFCYRCAVKKQHLHAYVDTKSMNLWTDGNYIPLSTEVDNKNIHYLLFVFEFTDGLVAEKMSNISMDVAQFVIQTCINLRGSKNFTESMNTVISDIQEKTDSFCSCIIMIDKNKQKFAPLCYKYRDDSADFSDFLEYLPPEVVFSWEETVKGHDNVIIKDEYDMAELEKSNPVWVKSLRSAGVKSLILVPLYQAERMMGVLFITDFNIEKLVKIKEFIELTGFFLSSEIASNDLMEKLEFMSNIDVLTGVRNRNSMNARVDWHVNGSSPVKTPFGVLFADLNGLKQCNDSGGHEAGDKLLVNAAKLLKKHFPSDEIFRAGGDEFVIICPQTSQEDFDKKTESLRSESGYGADVCLAIGTCWSNDADNLRFCMHVADEAMYSDKNDYYQNHPDKHRR